MKLRIALSVVGLRMVHGGRRRRARIEGVELILDPSCVFSPVLTFQVVFFHRIWEYGKGTMSST